MTAARSLAANEAAYREAERWIGTPFRHQGRRRAIGVDCLGLILGVAVAIGQCSIDAPATYACDWHARARDEPLWRGLQARFRERRRGEPSTRGDVLLFRLQRRRAACHLAILGEARLIHALARVGVVQTDFSAVWRRRLVARFEWRPNA